MLQKTKGIILKNVNYRDNSRITHIYTSEFGMQSFLINGVRNQKGSIRPSHLMPLNLVDLVIYYKENSQMHRIKELKCNPLLQTIHYDMVKNGIALFVTEIVDACAQEESSNPELFSFLTSFIQALDLEDEGVSNYPIYFLLQLSRLLGFAPKGEYKPGLVFDLLNGTFIERELASNISINEEGSSALYDLLFSSDWSREMLTKSARSIILDGLLRYYEIHALHGRKIKSHIVLREIL